MSDQPEPPGTEWERPRSGLSHSVPSGSGRSLFRSDTSTSSLRSSDLRVTLIALYQGPQTPRDSILAVSSRCPCGVLAAECRVARPPVGDLFSSLQSFLRFAIPTHLLVVLTCVCEGTWTPNCSPNCTPNGAQMVPKWCQERFLFVAA